MANDTKKTYGEVIDPKNKIGKYKEAAGGGTPISKGEHFEIADSPQEAAKLRKQGVKNVRVNQPRDEDGQFTYNSANQRPLEYGPSRGTTIPPFMKGLVMTWAKKSAQGAIVTDDGTFKLPKDMDAEKFIKTFQEYRDGGFGEFGDLSGKANKRVAPGKGSHIENISNKQSRVFDAQEFVQKFPEMIEAWNKHKKDNNLSELKWAKKTTPVAPTTTPKPSQQQPATTTPAAAPTNVQSQPQVSSSNNSHKSESIDLEMLKTDPKAFKAAYSNQIQDIISYADSKDLEINVDDLMGVLKSGNGINNFGQIKAIIDEASK